MNERNPSENNVQFLNEDEKISKETNLKTLKKDVGS
jgi:hypothetical protein